MSPQFRIMSPQLLADARVMSPHLQLPLPFGGIRQTLLALLAANRGALAKPQCGKGKTTFRYLPGYCNLYFAVRANPA